MMGFLVFMVRYTPFWAVPVFILCISFFFIYWAKDIKRVSYFLIVVGFIQLLFLGFWMWVGGPVASVRWLHGFMDTVKTL
jgi:hypothetical protein